MFACATLSDSAEAERRAPRASEPVLHARTSTLKNFHRAFARADRGGAPLRVLQFGASHTASDFFADQLRSRLQGALGDAGHGFVMPVRPWSRYRHIDIRTRNSSDWTCQRSDQRKKARKGLYGLAGFACETAEKGAWGRVRPWRHARQGTRADTIEVFYAVGPRGGRFRVMVDGRVAARIQSRARHEGVRRRSIRVPDKRHEVEVQVDGGGTVRLYGLTLERRRAGAIVDTLGINGVRATTQLRWNEELWSELMDWRAPDLVILAYGTNFVRGRRPLKRYAKKLAEVLRRTRDAAPQASCVLMGPSDQPRRRGRRWVHRERQDEVIAVQKRVAAQQGCAHWDMAAAMGGPGSMKRWVRAGLARRDHVHLKRSGYKILADRFLADLLPREAARELTVR